MSNLSKDQFGAITDERLDFLTGSHWRTYTGQPGEPKPDDYNRESDYLADHHRWSTSRDVSKPFRDPDVGKLKARAEEKEEPLKQEHRERQQRVAVQHKELNSAVRNLRSAMPRKTRVPKLKKPGKIRRVF